MEKEKTYSYYCEYIKREIDKCGNSIDAYLQNLPLLFKVLTGLLDQRTLYAEDRKMVLCALGYFVAPNDVIPERVYGPAGYVDDIYICCWVLHKILNKYGVDFISQYWDSKDCLKDTIELCLQKAKSQLNEIADDVLEYAGFKEEKQ